MKKTNSFILFFLISFFLGTLCISCAQLLNKSLSSPSYVAKSTISPEIENITKEAFQLYHQNRLVEAVKKLKNATNFVPVDTPTWSAAILYAMLAFFQEKSGDSINAQVTYKIVQDLFGGLKGTWPESEVLAKKLLQFGQQLRGEDQIRLLERLLPISSKSQGKVGESFIMMNIAEVYLRLNNYQGAYERGKEAFKLARESGQMNLEVLTLMTVSGSLIFLGRAHEAESLLQEVLPKIQEEPILKANILAQFGLVHAALGREESTIQAFHEASTIVSSLEATDFLARLHSKFGLAYLFLNKPQMAVKELMEALSFYEKLNDKMSVAIVEGIIAQAYFENGAFEEAKQHASHAADLYHRLGNRIEEAKNLNTIGQSLAELNNADEALKVLQKAVDIANAKDFGDKGVEAEIRSALGNVYRELGFFSEAIEEYNKVLELCEQLHNKRLQIITLLRLASIFHRLRDSEQLFWVLSLAERLGDSVGDPTLQILILNRHAMVLEYLGDTVETLQMYLKALDISRKIDKKSEFFQLQHLGSFYRGIGEYAKSLNYFEKALILAKELGDKISESITLQELGLTYLEMEQPEDALRVSREALKIVKPLKSKYDEYNALSNIGLALKFQRNYEAALKVEQECLQLALESGNPRKIKSSYSVLGSLYLAMGQDGEAIEAFGKAIEEIEFLTSKIHFEEHMIGFFEGELSPYEGLIEAFYNLYLSSTPKKVEFAEDSLSFAEASKARILMQQIFTARGRLIFEGIPLEVIEELHDLRNQARIANRDYEHALSRYGVPDVEIEKKARSRQIAIEKVESFREKLRKEYPKFEDWGLMVRLNELPIRDKETLIVYKVGFDWTYAWVIKNAGEKNEILRFIRLPVKTAELKKIVMKLLTPIKKIKYKEFDTNACAELFDNILKPVLVGVNVSERLIIIPDGVFNLVPFELLVTDTGCNNGFKNACFLSDKFILSYYPSAMIFRINRRARRQALPPKGSMLAIGDPVYGPDDERLTPSQVSLLPESEKRDGSDILTRRDKILKRAQDQGYTFDRLKYSGIEVRKISEVFGTGSGLRDLLIGFEASESRVKSKDLTQYQLLHFAVHGILAYDVPYLKEPALVLATDPDSKEDGFLTLSEIFGLKLNADLVTLSACNTGLGLRVAGEGVIGLSRAFMNAGSRSVLVSLWEVADESTAFLMEEFYRLLSQGEEKVEALAKAKYKLRQKGYENPYFWAPFILIGD